MLLHKNEKNELHKQKYAIRGFFSTFAICELIFNRKFIKFISERVDKIAFLGYIIYANVSTRTLQVLKYEKRGENFGRFKAYTAKA